MKRLVVTSALFLAFLIAYLILTARPASQPPSPDSSLSRLAETGAEQLAQAVRLFEMDHGRLPATLDELLSPPRADLRYVKDRINLIDAWGRPFGYRIVEEGHVEVWCLGADGAPGGSMEDADILRSVKRGQPLPPR